MLCDIGSTDTIAVWRKLGVLKKAEAARKRHYIKELRDGKRHDWTRIAWWLERRYPLEFSRPEVAHVIRQSLVQNNTVNNFVISSELAEQLAQRSGKVDETIKRLFEGKDRVLPDREIANSNNDTELNRDDHFHAREVAAKTLEGGG